MNDELKIANLRADQKRIQKEVTDLVMGRMQMFTDKYNVDADIELKTFKSYNHDGTPYGFMAETTITFKML